MQTLLKTHRAYLTVFSKEDLDDLIKMMADPVVMKSTGFRGPKKAQEVKELLEIWSLNAHAPLGVWCARTRDTHNFIGWFMLKQTDLPFPEVGFMLARKYWSQGYATEVTKAILTYAREELGLQRVLARVDRSNLASKKVLEKCEMELNDKDSQTLIYKIRF